MHCIIREILQWNLEQNDIEVMNDYAGEEDIFAYRRKTKEGILS